MAAAREISTVDKTLIAVCDGADVFNDGTLSRNELFSIENNGTAKFLGSYRFGNHTMKAANSTSKRSLRAEFSKNELLNMLCFFEGELQACEVVIAALKNDRVKHLLHMLQSGPVLLNDPYAAVFRDKVACAGNLVSRQASVAAVQAEMEVRTVIEQQMNSLYQMVTKQRATHVRIVKMLTESLENNQRLRQELEEEKRKHEHDTAQGDDITYGLEMERTKLKQELETERTNRKKLEKDLKKLQETLDYERDRQKQIVLYLMAERKRIVMKYVEERKRSEDLAQILSEEKQRSDAIAEGLEEESKKSLRMEAELEKQSSSIENERKAIKISLTKQEKRIKELELEVAQLRAENETLRKQGVPLRMQSSHNVPAPTLPAKIRSISEDASSAAAQSSMVNVAKIVQPTATVSSVPVSGPTTGIARSISPGQSLRQQSAVTSENISTPLAKVTPRKLSNASAPGCAIASASIVQQQQLSSSSSPLSALANTIGTLEITQNVSSIAQPLTGIQSITSQTVPSAMNIGKIPSQLTSGVQVAPLIMNQQQTATILRSSIVSGSMVCGPSQQTNLISSQPISMAVTPGTSSVGNLTGSSGSRGVPPPIPPNKPIIPPKREPSMSRLGPITPNNISSNTTS